MPLTGQSSDTTFSARAFLRAALVVTLAAMVLCGRPAGAQEADDSELLIRLQRAEDQVRQLTGQVEQLQHRNRLLEQQLQQAGANAPQSAPQASASASPAPAAPMGSGAVRRDVFNPAANPQAPGAPRTLGAMGDHAAPGQADIGAPGGREAGAPLDLSRPGAEPVPQTMAVPDAPADATAQPAPAPAQSAEPVQAPATAPPSQNPRDLFDLGYGYVLHKDYALAEDTLAAFLNQYPNDPLAGDAQYWLGEARFQRQNYRDAAEAFLTVSTKFGDMPRAPEALLRLGQSLVAMGEKDAGCAALGEIARKYPRANAQVKQSVTREKKRSGC